MVTFDIIILISIVLFGMFGYSFRTLHSVLVLLGTILAAYIVSQWHVFFSGWLIDIVDWGEHVASIVSLFFAFFVLARGIGFIAWFFERYAEGIRRFRIVRLLDRIGGFVCGVVVGAVTVSFLLTLGTLFPVDGMLAWMDTSFVVPYILLVGAYILPFVPGLF